MVTGVKKIVLWFMGTVTALVLLFGYHTSTSSTRASAGADSSAVAPVQGGTGSSDGSTSSGSSSGSASSSGSSTVTGDVAQTRWGPVQVRLTVAGGKVTDVSVVEYPDNNGRDQEINARALPVLVQETLDAQSSKIDMVSGATVTSDGYVESLQSALDKAGL
jgi:major membrane immunogen (membrane-anchored lipoprotein)